MGPGSPGPIGVLGQVIESLESRGCPWLRTRELPTRPFDSGDIHSG